MSDPRNEPHRVRGLDLGDVDRFCAVEDREMACLTRALDEVVENGLRKPNEIAFVEHPVGQLDELEAQPVRLARAVLADDAMCFVGREDAVRTYSIEPGSLCNLADAESVGYSIG